MLGTRLCRSWLLLASRMVAMFLTNSRTESCRERDLWSTPSVSAAIGDPQECYRRRRCGALRSGSRDRPRLQPSGDKDMAEWLYHLPVVWMALVVFAGTSLVTGVVYGAVLALATGGRARAFKAVSPATLTPLAVVFGLLVGFLAAQVWSDAQRATAAVTREASALRTVVLLAPSFPGEPEVRLRALVRRHIQDAVSQEWPALAQHQATLAMIPAAVTEALQLTLSVLPQSPAQTLAQRELVSALQSALDARRERIIISRSVINWVKWAVVILLAVLILLAIAIVHSDNRAAAAIAMALFSIGVAACVVLIASHNRPFTGGISVGPDVLLQVMPKE
jgi:Protein of unknown function (DUF4239)